MFELPARVESVAHVIQVALTPVFLLTGVASLLGVFLGAGSHGWRTGSTPSPIVWTAPPRMNFRACSAASPSCAVGRTCSTWPWCSVVWAASRPASQPCFSFSARCAIRRSPDFSSGLSDLALIATAGALGAFLAEMLLASRGIRDEVATSATDAAIGDVTGREPANRELPKNS